MLFQYQQQPMDMGGVEIKQHKKDLIEGVGEVALPHALAGKNANAGKEWGWHLVFLPASICVI